MHQELYHYNPNDVDAAIQLGVNMLFHNMFRGKTPVMGQKNGITEEIMTEDGEFHPLLTKVGEIDYYKKLGCPPGVLIAVNEMKELIDIANRIRVLSELKKLVSDEITGTAVIHGINTKVITENIIPKYGYNMPLLALFPNPVFLSRLNAIPDIPEFIVIYKEWIKTSHP